MPKREPFSHLAKVFLLGLALLGSFFLAGCQDEYVYPEVREDIMTGYFSFEKGLDHVLLDDGSSYKVLESEKTQVYMDSVGRVIALYELVSSEGAGTLMKIYSLNGVFCDSPVRNLDEPLWGDPITLESAWKSSDYLNLRLIVKTTGKEHGFRFVETGREMVGDTLCLSIVLDHDLRDNLQGYSGHIFASLPLREYRALASHLRITLLCGADDNAPHVYDF